MSQNKRQGESIIPIMILALIIISIIAGAIDTYFYGEFISIKGISKWSFELIHPKYIVEYLTSFPGSILTVLSLSPWLFVLGATYWPELKERTKL